MPEMDGKVGFVTGGGTGIGLACAQAMVEAGGGPWRLWEPLARPVETRTARDSGQAQDATADAPGPTHGAVNGHGTTNGHGPPREMRPLGN